MPNTTVCPLAKKCGGCQLQNLSYPEQLHLKQATAIRLLGRFGHVEEILGMDDPYHYRNKVQAAFGVNRQGQIISGVYQSASHRIVPVSDCLIEDKVADRIIVTIRKLLKSFKIRPYDEDTGRGTLRHVLVRRGWRSGGDPRRARDRARYAARQAQLRARAAAAVSGHHDRGSEHQRRADESRTRDAQ